MFFFYYELAKPKLSFVITMFAVIYYRRLAKLLSKRNASFYTAPHWHGFDALYLSVRCDERPRVSGEVAALSHRDTDHQMPFPRNGPHQWPYTLSCPLIGVLYNCYMIYISYS